MGQSRFLSKIWAFSVTVSLRPQLPPLTFTFNLVGERRKYTP